MLFISRSSAARDLRRSHPICDIAALCGATTKIDIYRDHLSSKKIQQVLIYKVRVPITALQIINQYYVNTAIKSINNIDLNI